MWLLDLSFINKYCSLLLCYCGITYPQKTGERIKTDKRDALKLAKLFKTEDQCQDEMSKVGATNQQISSPRLSA